MKPIELTEQQRRIIEAMERGEPIRLLTPNEALATNKAHAHAVVEAWRGMIGADE